MADVHIITPVKDSVATARITIEAIAKSKTAFNFNFTVFDDFSTDENSEILKNICAEFSVNLVHLKDLTSTPSPNYRLILELAQNKAIEEKAHLIIVESDVKVQDDTIQKLMEMSVKLFKPGLIAAVTTDINGIINFPYNFAQRYISGIINTKKRLSFCCTLLTNDFLNSFSFQQLDPRKNWYDVFISHKSVEKGFNNYLLTDCPVLHTPHSSRPWKNLKYTNPLKYYWLKFIKQRDKI